MQVSPEKFTILQTLTIFEILSIIGLVAAVASLIISVRTGIKQSKTDRAAFSFEVFKEFSSKDVYSAYQEIEWGEFKYPYDTETGFGSKEQERRIDRLLAVFDELASMIDQSVLTDSDRDRWQYQGRRLFGDPGIQNYLHFLDQWYADNRIDMTPHHLARHYFGN